MPPGEHHGSDSAADGSGVIREPRMYQLIRQTGPIEDAVFVIEFLDRGRLRTRSRLVSGECCWISEGSDLPWRSANGPWQGKRTNKGKCR